MVRNMRTKIMMTDPQSTDEFAALYEVLLTENYSIKSTKKNMKNKFMQCRKNMRMKACQVHALMIYLLLFIPWRT